MKIFGLGFQKTGTTSLAEALRILNFKVCDTQPKLLPYMLKGQFKHPKIKRYLDNYQAFEDFPWPFFFKDWTRLFPDAYFIHTIRNAEDWYQSLSHHIAVYKKPIHRFVYGYNMQIPPDKKQALNIYNKHNEIVESFFKNKKYHYLKIDLTLDNQWEKLCSFLQQPTPSQNFPHSNKKSENKKNDSSTTIAFKRIKYQVRSLQLAQLQPNTYNEYLNQLKQLLD